MLAISRCFHVICYVINSTGFRFLVNHIHLLILILIIWKSANVNEMIGERVPCARTKVSSSMNLRPQRVNISFLVKQGGKWTVQQLFFNYNLQMVPYSWIGNKITITSLGTKFAGDSSCVIPLSGGKNRRNWIKANWCDKTFVHKVIFSLIIGRSTEDKVKEI